MGLKNLVALNVVEVNEGLFMELEGNDYFEISEVCNALTSYASKKYGFDLWERKKGIDYIKNNKAKRSEIIVNLVSRTFKGEELKVYKLENEDEYIIITNRKWEY